MRAFIRHHGTAAPLPRANVDTDMIIRIERFMMLPRQELGAHAFEMLRRRPDGEPDPDCVFNQQRFHAASIIVAGRNFGCGSSREAAVWALDSMGIRCIVAPSFGDIFRENCIKNGILPIVLDEEICEQLTRELLDAATPELAIDLEALQIGAPGGSTIVFTLGDFERQQLLRGTDEISLTREFAAKIDAHFARWFKEAPWSAFDATTIGGKPKIAQHVFARDEELPT